MCKKISTLYTIHCTLYTKIMKRFVITILVFIAIPLIPLVGMYLWTDPFRCIHAFDINDVDATNREYLSTELFLRNNPTYHYNSFIFASSRGGGMNTYQWKQYLPDGAQPFLFQAWAESLTGIELKMDYLNEHHIPIDNALILIDIPEAFRKEQLPHEALSMKHYLFTNQSKFGYNVIQFWNFIQKPSFWKKSIMNKLQGGSVSCESDTITNDWVRENRYHYTELPPQDSLKQCSEISRRAFFERIARSGGIVDVSEPLINEYFEKKLYHIQTILNVNHTDYHIILTPGYCYTDLAVSPKDLVILQQIFGVDRVHNYTGKNYMTEDYNNYIDPGHFGLRVGFMMVQEIYGNERKEHIIDCVMD